VTGAGFLTVAVVAAVTQLMVLPGEKVQFIIAGLSSRYEPGVVVAAAGSAFAGWTALEIYLGAQLQGALPPAVLDAVTAALFLSFALLLVRSAPAAGAGRDAAGTGGIERVERRVADASVLGVGVPDRMVTFVSIFAMMAVGEFGDKTQTVTIALALQYGATPAIWVGEMAAIVPVSLANAYLFHRLSGRTFSVRTAHLVGASVFAFFGVDTLLALTVNVSVWETAVSTVSEAVLALG
jgi:putative Ca2+/H+ antiporter (TMEM165/GDT1 family)